MRLVYVLLFLLLPSVRAEQESGSQIAIPSLGWVFDREVKAVRPILGTLGAAILGSPIDVGFPIANAGIQIQNGFAIAVSDKDQLVRLVKLGGGGAYPRLVDGADMSPDRIVLSPGGTAAMLYYAKAGRVQLITGLPDIPVVSREFWIPDGKGSVTNLAVSDNGQRGLLIIGDEDGSSLWALDQNTGVYRVHLSGRPAAVAFRPNGGDAVVVTRAGELYLVDGSASLHYGVIAEEKLDPVGVHLSRDSRHTYIAYASGVIADIDTTTGVVKETSCGCRASGLYALTDSSVFRINELSTSPLLLVNVSETGPRVWFVPTGRTPYVSGR